MAANLNPIFPKNVKLAVAQILPADTTVFKTLFDPPTEGCKIIAILVSSDDTSARDLQLGISKGGVDHPLGTITIPITAGQIAATAAINFLDIAKIPGLPIDKDGQRYLILDDLALLRGKVLVAVTAAKAISIVILYGEF